MAAATAGTLGATIANVKKWGDQTGGHSSSAEELIDMTCLGWHFEGNDMMLAPERRNWRCESGDWFWTHQQVNHGRQADKTHRKICKDQRRWRMRRSLLQGWARR